METQTQDVQRFAGMASGGRPAERAYVVLLGLDTFDLPAFLKLMGDGFTWKTLQRFARNTGLSLKQLAEWISVPKRTLARRKASGRLLPEESDRLARAARLYGRALGLFDGDASAATQWFLGRNTALGGVPPIEFSRTEAGAIEVEHVIGRAEHGVFS